MRLLLGLACAAYLFALSSAIQYNSGGNAFDRSKVFVGWSDVCDEDIVVATGAVTGVSVIENIGALLKKKNQQLGDIVEKLAISSPLFLNQSAERRIADHYADSKHRRKFEKKPERGRRRDILMAQLDVLLLARVRGEIPLEALASDDTSEGRALTLPTGIAFDAPFVNDEGNDAIKSVTSLLGWQAEASIKSCPEYQEAPMFTSKMRLKSTYLTNVYLDTISVPCGVTGEEIAALARALPCVKFSHVDCHLRPLEVEESSSAPSPTNPSPPESCSGCATTDDLTATQWHLNGAEQFGIKAQQAWTKHTGYRDRVVIGIVDTGGDWHRDLKQNIHTNEGEAGELCSDGIDNDENGYIDDCHGWNFDKQNNDPFKLGYGSHGTPVAGSAAARGNNGFATVGSCPYCQVVFLRTANRLSATVEAHEYLIIQKIKVSNHSYGGYGAKEAERAALLAAEEAGQLVITTAGNDNCDLMGTDGQMCRFVRDGRLYEADIALYPFSPCHGYPELKNNICVGATTQVGEVAIFSSYGADQVAIYAPGHDILTLKSRDGSQAYMTPTEGTSFAAPIVAGAVAMKMGRNPDADYLEVKRAILDTATSITTEKAGIVRLLNMQSLIDEKEDSSGLPADTEMPSDEAPDEYGPPDYFVGMSSRYGGINFGLTATLVASLCFYLVE